MSKLLLLSSSSFIKKENMEASKDGMRKGLTTLKSRRLKRKSEVTLNKIEE